MGIWRLRGYSHEPIAPMHTRITREEAGGALTIDLGAIAANWLDLKKRAAPARCTAVVKADAYGLGLEPVARALAGAGCDTFFVALLDEAKRLRAALPTASIYVLDGLNPGSAAEFRVLRAQPVLGSLAELDEWNAFAKDAGERLPAAVHANHRHTQAIVRTLDLRIAARAHRGAQRSCCALQHRTAVNHVLSP